MASHLFLPMGMSYLPEAWITRDDEPLRWYKVNYIVNIPHCLLIFICIYAIS
jgi:hypothetical protein